MMTIMKHLRIAAATGILTLTLSGVATAAEPAPGQSFRPCDQCPEMVAITPGTVTAGNPKDFENPEPDAPKRPTITIKRPYALGKYEVTQAEWTAIMGANPSENKGLKNPVEHVDWKMAQDFIRKLNQKTGKSFRLPTEAEWEYAARAGSSASYSYGEDEKQLGQYAWFVENSGNVTHAVGQLKPNAFGLHDMHGNVWEWTGDCYMANFFATIDKRHSEEWETGCYRVTRGGSALNLPMAVTNSYRASLKQPLHNANLGFRLAMTLP
ncbi:MAG: formylglycine-generating enzyme family protein [Phaeospirillum sp.]|nr:formylglycine-generating enzyme family protein [Phaeospirillum sp.]